MNSALENCGTPFLFVSEKYLLGGESKLGSSAFAIQLNDAKCENVLPVILIKYFGKHKFGVRSIASCPKDKLIAIGSYDSDISVFNENLELIQVLKGHSSGVVTYLTFF